MTPDFLAPSAERDLSEAVRWLALDNSAVADAFRHATLASMQRIVECRMLGRRRLELAPSPYRFWRVAGFPYLIVYNAARQPPLVLRVLHMSRDLSPLLASLARRDTEDL